MNTSFEKFAGWGAILAGVSGLLYSIAFVVLQDNLLSALFLLLGGLFSTSALTALYQRLRATESGFALLGIFWPSARRLVLPFTVVMTFPPRSTHRPHSTRICLIRSIPRAVDLWSSGAGTVPPVPDHRPRDGISQWACLPGISFCPADGHSLSWPLDYPASHEFRHCHSRFAGRFPCQPDLVYMAWTYLYSNARSIQMR